MRDGAHVILIVDDFEDNRDLYAEYLKSVGYAVEVASDGRSALDKTHEVLPDLIVMDISLPDMDGGEVTRQIKAHDRTKHIPVLALTGYARASGEGMAWDAYVTKPCLPEALAEEIKRMLAAKPT